MKVAVLILVVFFGVWVVKQITVDEPELAESATEAPLAVAPKITDQELNANFIPSDSDQKLNLEAPYKLALSSTSETWYEFESDYSGNITSASLLVGSEVTLDFNEYLYLPGRQNLLGKDLVFFPDHQDSRSQSCSQHQ